MNEPRSNLLPDKWPVRVTVISRQQDERVEQVTEGDLYRKGSSFYLRYTEEAPNPAQVKRRSSSSGQQNDQAPLTTVLVKLGQDEWKLTRTGAVKSEMTFALHKPCVGRYTSKVMSFLLETRTHRMKREDKSILLDNGEHYDIPIHVRWSYDLYIEEQCTGKFDIQILLEPIIVGG